MNKVDPYTVQLTINNQQIPVNLSTIPIISLSTVRVVTQYSLYSAHKLRIEANELIDIRKKLSAAKMHPGCNIAFSLFRCALTIAIVAGGVFGCMAALATGLSGVAIGVGVVAFSAYYALSHYNASRAFPKTNTNGLGNKAIILIAGWALPLFESCGGRITRLEKIEKQQTQSIADGFFHALALFSNKHKELIDTLTEDSESAERMDRKLPKSEYQHQCKFYGTALEEVNRANTYYKGIAEQIQKHASSH